ncbi:MAG: trypsin-like peptidase domain-containing protein [Candidatus Dormibacteraeota bacterium]|uniref:Trypsin-like peptidase domain-containing protein n=1 Tax=Candidatus Aeolococcus gillhamiae TaxID=3127015 RepID=A0A934K3T7_9BACT|nr:trypsin-like peptidase domain-containing protein [Candidatus Dormibacteraeota bacterium]
MQSDGLDPNTTSPPSSGAAPAGPPANAWYGAVPPPPPPPPPLPWGFAGETSWQPSPPHRARSRRVVAGALAGLFAVGVGAGVTAARVTSPSTPSSTTALIPSVTVPGGSIGGDTGNATPSTGVPSDTSGVAAKVTPGIVNINVTLSSGGGAAGTGMVITSTGEVLTNNHVIDGETSIQVQVPSTGTIYSAHVVGYSLTQDVALVQIDGGGTFHTVSLGNSSTVARGQSVVALGNALGRNTTPAVTTGIVTNLNQTITASDQSGADVETVSGLIQVSAPIQPGDSGGPLVDSSAAVIGMDTAAQSAGGRSSQQTSTVAYAIPINKAMTVVRQIQSGHSTSTVHVGSTRALLGVQSQDGKGGAQVVIVQGGSPAAGASITVGSLITSLDGTAVSSSSALRNTIVAHDPGSSVSVSWTDTAGASHTATVTLTSGPPA